MGEKGLVVECFRGEVTCGWLCFCPRDIGDIALFLGHLSFSSSMGWMRCVKCERIRFV